MIHRSKGSKDKAEGNRHQRWEVMAGFFEGTCCVSICERFTCTIPFLKAFKASRPLFVASHNIG